MWLCIFPNTIIGGGISRIGYRTLNWEAIKQSLYTLMYTTTVYVLMPHNTAYSYTTTVTTKINLLHRSSTTWHLAKGTAHINHLNLKSEGGFLAPPTSIGPAAATPNTWATLPAPTNTP